MVKVIGIINQAALTIPETGKRLWAGFSKTRSARERIGFCGMLRAFVGAFPGRPLR